MDTQIRTTLVVVLSTLSGLFASATVNGLTQSDGTIDWNRFLHSPEHWLFLFSVSGVGIYTWVAREEDLGIRHKLQALLSSASLSGGLFAVDDSNAEQVSGITDHERKTIKESLQKLSIATYADIVLKPEIILDAWTPLTFVQRVGSRRISFRIDHMQHRIEVIRIT